MTRAHYVKKARKDNPVAKKGESYWWWKFRYSPIRRSKDKPRRSQLTQSDFLGQWYELEDTIAPNVGVLRETMDTVDDLICTCQDSLGNMPEQLQESSSAGETLYERIEQLQEWLDEAQDADLEEMSEEELGELVGNMPSF